jgi:excisionase family DNA binding protein
MNADGAGTHPTGGAGTGPGREVESRDWLTPVEAADRARCGKFTVYRALESGGLHGHQSKRGGRWVIAPVAVDAWIQGLDGSVACGCPRLRLARPA